MANSPIFEHLCTELESLCSFDRLEARGTIRLAIKGGGLEPGNLSKAQAEVVIEKLLPAELDVRGVADAESICGKLVAALVGVGSSENGESPEAVFGRLGGS
jgi:hypothetical protein